MNLSDKLTRFYLNLQPPKLPADFELLHPQQNRDVQKITRQFFKKFYAGNKPRRLLLGINPGRLGAGITGINFTAPKQLTENCGISNPFKISSELSAEFIYEVIENYGGAESFYNNWFIGAVSPLGFVKAGRNINYYDDKKLMAAVTPFIVSSMQQLLSFGFNRDFCICIGEDKNYKFLSLLNEQYKWFDEIIAVSHPRFVMQYRRKRKQEYINQYLLALAHHKKG
jgi:hypothetical protein